MKPAIVVANRQKLPLCQYTQLREESMAVAQVWHYRGMRGNDRRSIDWSTGDYTHTHTYNQLLHQRMIPRRTAQNRREHYTVEKRHESNVDSSRQWSSTNWGLYPHSHIYSEYMIPWRRRTAQNKAVHSAQWRIAIVDSGNVHSGENAMRTVEKIHNMDSVW